MQDRYRIRFNHITDPAKVYDLAMNTPGVPADKVQAVTVCTIEDADKREIGRGVAFCSKRDTFVREKGRRVALADALDDAFAYETHGSLAAERLNAALRRERAYVWNLYFSRNEGRFDPRRKQAA